MKFLIYFVMISGKFLKIFMYENNRQNLTILFAVFVNH